MYPVLIRLGSFELRTYGVIVGLSFLLGLWLSVREAKRKGLDPALVQDFAFYAFLGGIVGARLYYVVLSQPDYFMRSASTSNAPQPARACERAGSTFPPWHHPSCNLDLK